MYDDKYEHMVTIDDKMLVQFRLLPHIGSIVNGKTCHLLTSVQFQFSAVNSNCVSSSFVSIVTVQRDVPEGSVLTSCGLLTQKRYVLPSVLLHYMYIRC